MMTYWLEGNEAYPYDETKFTEERSEGDEGARDKEAEL